MLQGAVAKFLECFFSEMSFPRINRLVHSDGGQVSYSIHF